MQSAGDQNDINKVLEGLLKIPQQSPRELRNIIKKRTGLINVEDIWSQKIEPMNEKSYNVIESVLKDKRRMLTRYERKGGKKLISANK